MNGGILIPKILAQAHWRSYQVYYRKSGEVMRITLNTFNFEDVYEIQCKCPGTLTAGTIGKKLLELRA